MRDRFARYVAALADSARRHGVTGVPFLINIHGTEGGNGVPFAIGVSQLFETYAGRAGFAAGSDHYLGDMSSAVTTDIHFINAAMAAVNSADQPLTSLEFEAGTGDYSGGLDGLYDPSTVDLKTRLCVAQGNRMINYYLLAGGINPPLDAPVGRRQRPDQLHRRAARHRRADRAARRARADLRAPPPASPMRSRRTAAGWPTRTRSCDDLTVGFWPDAFMTEYHYPGSAIMTEVVDDLAWLPRPGPAQGAVAVAAAGGLPVQRQQPAGSRRSLPRTVALSTGTVLDAAVQQRLVDHLAGGGSLLLTGRLPQRDPENRPCTVLADALGLRPGAARARAPAGTTRRWSATGWPGLHAGDPGRLAGQSAGASLEAGRPSRCSPMSTDGPAR